MFYNYVEKLNILKVYVLSLCFSGFIPLFVSYLEGSLYRGTYPFLGKFIVWPIMLIAIFPVLNVIIVQFYQKVKIAIVSLKDNKIIQVDPLMHRKIKEKLNFIKSKKKFAAQILLLIVVFSFYATKLTTMTATWAIGDYWGISLLYITIFVIYFIEVLILLNFIVDIFIWQKIEVYLIYEEKFKFTPKLFHSDNAAGLSSIGDVAFKIYQVAFLFLIAFIVQIIEKYIVHPSWEMIEIITEYKAIPFTFLILLFILPFTFFAPLFPFNKWLQKFKKNYKKKLSNLLSNELSKVETSFFEKIDNEVISRAQDDLLKLKKINEIYSKINNIPSWPYDKTTIQSVASSILLPILLSFISYILF